MVDHVVWLPSAGCACPFWERVRSRSYRMVTKVWKQLRLLLRRKWHMPGAPAAFLCGSRKDGRMKYRRRLIMAHSASSSGRTRIRQDACG